MFKFNNTKMNKARPTEQSFGRGFTLFVAIVIMGTLLLIAAGITNMAVKQAFLSSSGRESQAAFYAADTGMDCALYWDVNNDGGEESAFATSSPASTIDCNGDDEIDVVVVGSSDTYDPRTYMFEFALSPDPYCTIVTVNKSYVAGNLKTTIESRGYNTCDTNNPRRVERAVRATY